MFMHCREPLHGLCYLCQLRRMLRLKDEAAGCRKGQLARVPEPRMLLGNFERALCATELSWLYFRLRGRPRVHTWCF